MKHVAGRREPQVTHCFLNLIEAEVGEGKKPLKSIHCHGGAVSERFAHDSAQTRPLYRSRHLPSAQKTRKSSVGVKDKIQAEGEISAAASSLIADGT